MRGARTGDAPQGLSTMGIRRKMKQAKADREIELMAAIVNELRGGVAESNGRLAP